MRPLSMKTTAISVFGISVALGMAYATAWGATETPQSLVDAAYKAMGMTDVKLAAAEIVTLITRGSMQAWDPGESESVNAPMKPDWGTSTFAQFWDRSRGLYRIEWDRPRANGQRRKYTEILTDEYDGHMGGYVMGIDVNGGQPARAVAGNTPNPLHGVGVEAGCDFARIGTQQYHRRDARQSGPPVGPAQPARRRQVLSRRAVSRRLRHIHRALRLRDASSRGGPHA